MCGSIALVLASSGCSPANDVTALVVQVEGVGTVTSSSTGIACTESSAGTCTADASVGTTVTLTATSGEGDVLAGWMGACGGTATTCAIAVTPATADISVTAVFVPVSTSLAVLFTGDGRGSITSSPSGIACATGDTCTGAFVPQTTVALTATPSTDSIFTGWSGGCTGSAPTCTTTIGSGLDTVRAEFEPATEPLTIDLAGRGTITATVGGLDCVDGAGECSANVAYGTTTTVRAVAAPGWQFARWNSANEACADAGAGDCELRMADPITLDPVFTQDLETLSVSFEGGGPGEVIATSSACGSDDCFDCPNGACSASFDYGATVTLTASPGSGSTFTGWSGLCPDLGPCTVTMDQFTEVVATFADLPEALTVRLTGPGSGSVTATGYVDCAGGSGTTCDTSVPANTLITLEARPSPTATFVGWTGACTGSGWICTVDLTAAATVTADFALANFTLEVSLPTIYLQEDDAIGAESTQSAGAVVATGSDGVTLIDCGEGASTCSVTLPANSRITLTGTPSGSNSLEWWGDACSDSHSATCTITLTSNMNLYALFSTVELEALSVQISGGGESIDVTAVPESATIATCGGACTYFLQRGIEVDLGAYADPDSDYVFDTWEGACSGNFPYCEFTVTGDVSASAEFDEVEGPRSLDD